MVEVDLQLAMYYSNVQMILNNRYIMFWLSMFRSCDGRMAFQFWVGSITYSYPSTSPIKKQQPIKTLGRHQFHVNPQQHVHEVYPTTLPWGTSSFSFSFSVSSGTTAIGVWPEVEWIATTTSCCQHLGTNHGKNLPKLRYSLEKWRIPFGTQDVYASFCRFLHHSTC